MRACQAINQSINISCHSITSTYSQWYYSQTWAGMTDVLACAPLRNSLCIDALSLPLAMAEACRDSPPTNNGARPSEAAHRLHVHVPVRPLRHQVRLARLYVMLICPLMR